MARADASSPGQEVSPPSPSNSPVVHEREVSTNLEICVMRTERGRDEAQSPQAAPGEQAEVEPVASSGPSSADGHDGSAGGMAALATRSAWHRTFHEDPPGFDVNSSTTHVSWSYENGCVQSSWDHYTRYTWLAATGWYKDSSSTTAGRTCTYARTTSHSVFKNWPFCITFLSTTTRYEPNQIRGRWDGAYVMSWSASKSGDCSYLLSFHRTHGSS